MYRAPRTLRRQIGFSLIEVLVSLVILAVGMLGTVGLMLATLKSNQLASQASVAARLATEFQEIMALNVDQAVDTGNGTSVFTNIDTQAAAYADTNPTTCLGNAATCTPTQLYAFLINEWILRVNTQLPNGVVKVCRDNNPKDSNGIYRWACTGTTSSLLTIKFGWAAKSDKGETTFSQSGSDTNPPRFVVTLSGTQQDNIANCNGAAIAC